MSRKEPRLSGMWVPNLQDPHSHVYFFVVRNRVVGKIAPNPTTKQRNWAPWFSYVTNGRGGWKKVGDAWHKEDAQGNVALALNGEQS